MAEEVSKAMGKVLVEMVKEIKSSNSPRITESIEEPVDEIPEVIHTKNPKLNSVLAKQLGIQNLCQELPVGLPILLN